MKRYPEPIQPGCGAGIYKTGKDMQKKHSDLINNEDGFVLGGAILISAILILAGVLALWTSTTEVQVVRNEGLMIREFYDAEGGIIDALVNYNTGSTDWLTDDFLIVGPAQARNIVISNDQDGQPISEIQVRCIRNDYSDDDSALTAELSAAANTLPQQSHINPPPTGSGYSLRYFEVRRYGITAKSNDGNTTIQVGAWKVFNKF